MGKDVTDKSDASGKSDENPEVQSVREENRRLFELVERLIATQESEQQHRKIIETELQQMKLALVEQSSSAGTDAIAGKDASDLSKTFEKLIEKLGSGLEGKLLAKMDALETRITDLAIERGDERPEDSRDSERLVNATWKMIAPLGGELERLSAMMQDLGQRVDRETAESRSASPELAQELKSLVEEIKQLRGEVSARPQLADENDTTEALEGLDTRVQEVSETLHDLLIKQEGTQTQASSLLHGLVESHMERLSREWAGQIAGFQRSVDDLLLDRTVHIETRAGDGRGNSVPSALDDGAAGAHEATPNVVAGDFPAFQHTDAKSVDEKTALGDQRGQMSQDLKREVLAMDARPDDSLLKPIDDKGVPSNGLGRELSDNAAEDSNAEDALLTEPADWRSDAETEDEAIVLTHPILPEGVEEASGGSLDSESVKQVELANETAAATSGRREIDLRAFKDLRLSSEPGDVKDPPVTLPTGVRGPSYENAPAEASLTRFVRLIRARKRSSPS